MRKAILLIFIALIFISGCAPAEESTSPISSTPTQTTPDNIPQTALGTNPVPPLTQPSEASAPTPIPTEDSKTTPLYPGAVESEVPHDLRQTLGLNDNLLCEGYTVPAAPSKIMAWYHEHLPGWTLQTENESPIPDRPDSVLGVQYYKKESRGIFIFTQSGFTDGTLMVIASGSWTDIEKCGLAMPGGSEGNEAGEPDLPQATPLPWVQDAIVQPVPPGASSVRLQLPVPIDKIMFTSGGMITYGMHGGGHPEGFDHIALPVQPGTPIGSWADGEVKEVKPSGEIELGEYCVVVYYGDGLWGRHTEVKTPVVKAGDKVKAGDPIGIGMSFVAGTESGEFALIDNHRTDGPNENGVHVSPYDYLREDVQKQFIAAYEEKVLKPYLSRGLNLGLLNAWEPYLTNPLLIHRQHKGTLVGEWYLNAPWEIGGLPDVMILKEADTKYYNQNRITALDSTHGEIEKEATYVLGTWEADYQKRQIRIKTDQVTYYGIYELDETGDRATLKIEYQEGSYPTGFSDKAAIYIERRPITRMEDAVDLGVVPASSGPPQGSQK